MFGLAQWGVTYAALGGEVGKRQQGIEGRASSDAADDANVRLLWPLAMQYSTDLNCLAGLRFTHPHAGHCGLLQMQLHPVPSTAVFWNRQQGLENLQYALGRRRMLDGLVDNGCQYQL